MNELTSNPDREQLDEVKVMGRTVYVSHDSECAYVEFQDELVSMTNLRAWNILLERAKKEAIDGYEGETTLAEKELDRVTDRTSKKIRRMAAELDSMAQQVKSVGKQ